MPMDLMEQGDSMDKNRQSTSFLTSCGGDVLTRLRW